MNNPPRLAVICTHPIPYYIPVFQLLSKHTLLKVFYTTSRPGAYDKGFHMQLEWDIPLLKGYRHEFLKNDSFRPGTHHFFGTVNMGATAAISRFRPDYLLIYGWANHSHFSIIRHYHGTIPVLFRGDSNMLRKSSQCFLALRKITLKYIYKHINIALYTGAENRIYFKYYGLKEHQLIFAPHAIDNNRFSRTSHGPSLRKALGIDEKEILILFTGKMTRDKNPQLVLETFIDANIPQASLLLVGSGPLAKKLSTKYKHPRIHFLPFQNQSEMPRIYQSCDLFCMPSTHETWGLALNEAMAAAKAVLVSDRVGAATDLVRPAWGMCFKSNDKNDLQNKLRLLTTDRKTLVTMGLQAQKFVREWSFSTQVKSILHALSIQ